MVAYKEVDRRDKVCTADRMVDGIVGGVAQVTRKMCEITVGEHAVRLACTLESIVREADGLLVPGVDESIVREAD